MYSVADAFCLCLEEMICSVSIGESKRSEISTVDWFLKASISNHSGIQLHFVNVAEKAKKNAFVNEIQNNCFQSYFSEIKMKFNSFSDVMVNLVTLDFFMHFEKIY